MKKFTFSNLILVIFLAVALPLQAHNNYFLPGDAFFSVSLSRKTIREWSANKSDTFTFEYRRFDGAFMACGNIGYTKLQVTGIDENFRTALAEAYWRYEENPIYRQDGEEDDELTQINSVVALIYNADFSGPLGLKLNEDWISEGGGIYAGLIKTDKAVIDDWKMAAKYPPLNLDSKIGKLQHLTKGPEVHHTVDKPLLATASKLKIFLVGHSEMKGYFPICPNLEKIHDVEAEYISYFKVTANGFVEHSIDERYSDWTAKKTTLPLESSKSMIPKK